MVCDKKRRLFKIITCLGTILKLDKIYNGVLEFLNDIIPFIQGAKTKWNVERVTYILNYFVDI